MFEASEVAEILKMSTDRNPRGSGPDHDPSIPGPERLVRGFQYNMKAFLEDSIADDCNIGNASEDKLKHVDTPFIDEGREGRYVTGDREIECRRWSGEPKPQETGS